MARTKGKGNVAASNVPSKVEAVSSNDMIAESAPSESVENEEAAMTMILDEPVELHKKEEETKDGPDEAEEVDENEETKDGSDKSCEVDKKEETKTGPDVSEEEGTENRLVESEENKTKESKDDFYESEDIDKMEESKDGLDNSEDEDGKDETENAVFESEEGAQDAKEDVKVVPMGTDVSEGEKVEEGAVMGTDVPEGEKVEKVEEGAVMGTDVPGGEKVEEGAAIKEVKDLGKEENTPKKKAKRIRKKKKKVASNGADKSGGADKQGTSAAVKKDMKMADGMGLIFISNAKTKMGTDVPGAEKVEEGAAIKEVKDLGKEENTPKKKAKRIRKKKKKVASNGADKSSGADKQGTSAAVKKDMKMDDGMGLIFMCNAKTKMDCFRYKVFGLPASKREMVAKIYKGMRLFLFDVDLKLLYGIYKAASPGGYNVEPKAFESGFPSQVRFHVLNDCLPLPEEKFKAAIKGNYYGRNKFNCQLSPEQVKDLCKLFQSEGKTINKKRPREVVRAETEQISSSRGSKRARRERARYDDSIPKGRDSYPRREAIPSLPPRSRDIAPRSGDVRAEPERISSSQRQKRSIRERARRGDLIPRGRDPYVRREVYSSPPPRALALPPPTLPQAPYAYGRSVDDRYYRREAPLLDPRDHRGVDLETRPVEPLGYRDPYRLYWEPLSREAACREPLSREAWYREPLLREAGYREPLSREAGYREPVPYGEALYPTSSTPAAAPIVYYRY